MFSAEAGVQGPVSKAIEENCFWIFLQGDYNTILERLENRRGHYMPPTLLQSQFDALEAPSNAMGVDIRLAPETIIENIMSKLS